MGLEKDEKMPGGIGKEKGIERNRVQEECLVTIDGRASTLPESWKN